MFIFKGKNSNDMGVYVREENFLGKAPMKHDEIHIDGRDGEELIPLGYQNYHGTLNDVVIMNDNFDEVLHWLSGTGELIYKGKKTIIHFLDGYEIKKHKKPFSIPFIRSPFWYALEDDYSEAWGANLIPNGWDSFEPHESGENYVDNWDFSADDLKNWSRIYGVQEIVEGKYRKEITQENPASRIENYTNLEAGEYVWVLKMKSNSETMTFRDFTNATASTRVSFKDTEYSVITIPFTVEETSLVTLRAYFDKSPCLGNWVEIDWNYISKVDNQHLVVEKTPLENGLTRIQTWGGNNRIKLVYYIEGKKDKAYTTSFYAKNNSGKSLTSQETTLSKRIVIDKEGYYCFTATSTSIGNMNHHVIADNKNDNLDFIASTPTIVEGDTPPTWEADSNPRIINEGTAPSKPLIKLTKGTTNTCEFEVNGVYFKYHFNNDDHVLIDCKEMEATYEGLPRNRHLTIGFEFPVLKPGDNVVKTISGDAKISFKRKDSWL